MQRIKDQEVADRNPDELFKKEMGQEKFGNLQEKIHEEKRESDLIFTEDDLNLEN